LKGGILYHDGQFDDARLLINLMQTATEAGAVVLSYARVIWFTRHQGAVRGIVVRDEETGEEFGATGRVVVNATGAFCDDLRRMADPAARPMVSPSQGTHLVFDRSFLPGDTALMVPKTPDGRVMFAIPWHGHTLVGTTDVAIPAPTLEPRATESEVEFILETAGRYLAKPPTWADVRSVFVGVRPLVKAEGEANTAELSRDHTLRVDRTGLVTITGGKWTTYRNMAEDCVNLAVKQAGLPARRCVTGTLRVHGYREGADPTDPLAVYGADADGIRELRRGERLHPALPYTEAEVIWAARHEMARTVEDVLARRTRALMLNVTAARESAPRVAELLAEELGRDAAWQAAQVRAFGELAGGYGLSPQESALNASAPRTPPTHGPTIGTHA
jgi:glycerol-3-phosphate dehydrogenase